MTKKERIARAQCSESPTGQHVFVMSWPEPRTYIGTCRYCNEVRQEDATLGAGQTTKVGKYARGTTVMMAGSHQHIRDAMQAEGRER